jgi:hypothetical protein
MLAFHKMFAALSNQAGGPIDSLYADEHVVGATGRGIT